MTACTPPRWDQDRSKFVGKEAVRAGFAKLLAHDSDSISEPGEVRAGDNWAVSTWGFRREDVIVRGCDVWQFRDGLVIRKDSFRKTFG